MIEFIYDMLYIAPLSLTAMLYWCGLFGVEEPTFLMYMAVLVPVFVLDLLVHLKARERMLVLGITGAVFVSVSFVVSRFWEDFYLSDHPWIIPLLIISVLSFLIGFAAANLTVFRIVVSLSVIVMLILSLEVIEYPAKKGVFAAFFFVLVCLLTEVHIRWKRFGDTNTKKHLVFTSLFIFAIVFTASRFNAPDKPYDWRLFKAIWSQVSETVGRLKFSIGPGNDMYIGFSDSGEIGSDVKKSDHPKPVLEVNVLSDINVPVNFTGNMYDSFDGHAWTEQKDPIANMRRMDALECLFSAKSGSEDYRDVIRDAAVNVKYVNAKTKYLFVASKLTDYSFLSSHTEITETSGVLTFDKHNPYRLEVKEQFYKLNTDSPAFYEYMSTDSVNTDEAWKSSLRTVGLGKLSDQFGYDQYLEYRESVKEKYCEDITLSSELKSKLAVLYDGARSDYEKLKRLEQALNKMKYTTDTEPIPESVTNASEFLDYFLLEEKEGYCTHYATAFVLLARAEGLPARYAAGYRINIEKAGTYTVTSNMAHAWPEVYFEGKGWIPFEPTPGFYTEISWTTVANKIIKKEPDKPKDVFSEPEVTIGDEETDTADEKLHISINPLVIIIPFGAILFVIAIYTLILRAVSRRKYVKMSVAGQAKAVAKDIFSLLSIQGFKRKESETLKEFADRISDEVGEEVYGFTETYELVLYSEKQSKNPEILPILVFREKVLERLKQRSYLRYLLRMLTSQF